MISLREYFDYVFSIKYNDKAKLMQSFEENTVISEKTYVQDVPEPNTVQIFPYYLSKELAVKQLLKELDISPMYVMIAADGENDLPMLKKNLAARQVVPANASETVKGCVRKNRGYVSLLEYSDGIVDAASQLLGI